ncbi:MAG: UDP-N-acetylglucosamine 1-carboxyvinyltransferase [Candidatus Marinamargulisbacteria bacterium]
MYNDTRLFIEGGYPLNGTIQASGAKNSALPILAACILTEGHFTIKNIPPLMDVTIMLKMLNALGVRAEMSANQDISLWNQRKIRHIAPYELVTAMRASFFVAGPILARTGFAKVPLPGGCAIGTRPLDIHLKGFRAMGVDVTIEHGFVQMMTQSLKGSRIYLDFPSVGATENIMMAATLADGTTIIENAAQEPEITDLAQFLNAAGAQITGAGSSTITIHGVQSLKGQDYAIIPDRVEVGTLMIAAAVTKGDVFIEGAVPDHIEPLIRKMKEAGADVQISNDGIRVIGHQPLSAVDIETLPFPGFPTDMQAQFMSMLCVSQGTSVVTETIFENRFMHVNELMRLGANIRVDQRQAIIEGVPKLNAAEVKITDLRAGAALIIAGLIADGETSVYGLNHLRRGYHDLPQKLRDLGAKIRSQ